MKLGDALRSLGLDALQGRFEAEGVDLADVPGLSNEDLSTLGVTRIGDRARLRELAKTALATPVTELPRVPRMSPHGAPTPAPGLTVRTPLPATMGPTIVAPGMLAGAVDADDVGTFPERVGSYRILGFLGAGNMGLVLRARHVEEGWARRQGGDVALKLVHTHLAADPAFRERFFAEAGLGRRVKHPSLVTTHEVVTEGAWLGMVMSLVQGVSLSAYVRPGGLPLGEACALLAPLASALDHLDALHIIHRDVKPGNVIVQPDGTPVLLDLGIAKDTQSADGMTRTTLAVGTSAWMAPEQADASKVDGAADRYALGLVAFALLTGHLPWPDDTSEARILAMKLHGGLIPLARAKPGLPSAVCGAVDRMLNLVPTARYGTATSFVDDLRSAPGPDEVALRTDDVPDDASQAQSAGDEFDWDAPAQPAPFAARSWPVLPVVVAAALAVLGAAGWRVLRAPDVVTQAAGVVAPETPVSAATPVSPAPPDPSQGTSPPPAASPLSAAHPGPVTTATNPVPAPLPPANVSAAAASVSEVEPPPPAGIPATRPLDTPPLANTLSIAAVDTVIRSHAGIRACFTAYVGTTGRLPDGEKVRMIVEPSGVVAAAIAYGTEQSARAAEGSAEAAGFALSDCLNKALLATRFPPFRGDPPGTPARFVYPFVLR
ncbi:MAG: hypothetical protein RLZZ299_3062 [Pseudomonadota bacterium]